MDWPRRTVEWTERIDRTPASTWSLYWRKRYPCDEKERRKQEIFHSGGTY